LAVVYEDLKKDKYDRKKREKVSGGVKSNPGFM
jgi:hypothetical protein